MCIYQLDLVISRRSLLNQVLVTRSYHSADCDTDHSLVASKVHLFPRRAHHSKQKPRPRINIARTNKPELREHFAIAIGKALEGWPTNSATKRWNHIREAVFQTALDTFGRRERKSTDWFKAGIAKLEPALLLSEPPYLLTTLWAARKDTQKIARRCANDYWLNLCHNIQLSADLGNVRGMYEGMKKNFGPSPVKTAPLKSAEGEIIKDRCKQMKRWAEHYKELYSRETTVTSTALEST